MSTDEPLPFDATCPNCVKGNTCIGYHWASEAEQSEFIRKVREAFKDRPQYKVIEFDK